MWASVIFIIGLVVGFGMGLVTVWCELVHKKHWYITMKRNLKCAKCGKLIREHMVGH